MLLLLVTDTQEYMCRSLSFQTPEKKNTVHGEKKKRNLSINENFTNENKYFLLASLSLMIYSGEGGGGQGEIVIISSE